MTTESDETEEASESKAVGRIIWTSELVGLSVFVWWVITLV